MIYHIVQKDKWQLFKSKTFYKTHSLEREGYIHCSFEDQVLKVANTFHKGQRDLLVLCIDDNKIKSIVKVEDLFNLNENYPHIYDELPKNAIEKVVKLEVSDTGDFIKPNLSSLSSLAVEEKEWT